MTDTGLPMAGGFLRPLPPNASLQDQTAAINEILAKLNSWNGVIVQQGTIGIQGTGALRDTFKVAHNLGYSPVPQAFLNAVDISGGGGDTINDANIPLPSWLSITIGATVTFPIWLSIYTDNTYFYVDMFNATGGTTSAFNVTYYLMRISADR